MPESFDGKTVIITGASTGIGADCAIEFAKRKANLVLNARNLEALEKKLKTCVSAMDCAATRLYLFLEI